MTWLVAEFKYLAYGHTSSKWQVLGLQANSRAPTFNHHIVQPLKNDLEYSGVQYSIYNEWHR